MKRLSRLALIVSVIVASFMISCTPEVKEVEVAVEQDSTATLVDSTIVDSVEGGSKCGDDFDPKRK